MSIQNQSVLTESEKDVQRYLQLRGEIKDLFQEEIKKVNNCMAELTDATKRMTSNVDVFESLSNNAAEHISKSIKSAAHEMATVATKGFSEAVDSKVGKASDLLNTSVREAKNDLQYVNRSKSKRNLAIAIVACIACLLGGYSANHFFTLSRTMQFDKEFVKVYNFGDIHKSPS